MKNRKKCKFTLPPIIAGIITALVLCICWHNYKVNAHFWDMSLSTGLSILIGVWVSFLLVQRQTDLRKKKDALCELMKSIQDIVTNEDAYLIDNGITQQSLTMRTRDLNNQIGILEKYGGDFGLDDDIRFVKEKANEYSQIIGDHLTDVDHLSKSALELQRPLNLIEARLFDMILKLY